MKTVATNIRFSKDDYEEIKKLAFHSKLSVASFIRKSIDFYKDSLTASKADRKKLFKQIVGSSIKIDTSTASLAKQGRKFE